MQLCAVPNGLLVVGLVVGVLGTGSCAGPGVGATGPAREARPGARRSNVERADYAGSDACEPCHTDVVAAWRRSPMHRMTRGAHGAEIRAPFDGTPWRFKDDTVVMDRRGEERVVRIERAGAVARSYRVTRVIGGRTREDYAGVDESGGREELILPVSFVYATGTLRYKGYSVMVHERDGLQAGPAWSRTCIFCHNTVPEMDRLLGAIAGPKSRPYQGEQVDRLLPEARREGVRVVDLASFAGAIRGEEQRLGGAPLGPGAEAAAVAEHAIDVVRAGFDGDALVEEGIGCEACHNGARDHARDPEVLPSLVPRAPWLDLTPHAPEGAEAVNRVCARCHQVLFSRYPFTWEGGRRDASPGGSHINSGEARDFLLGGCARAMACTACHDPHGGSDRARLQALATPDGNATCTGCHVDKAGPERARAHSHHDPAGPGGACLSCHMPRKNMGLDGKLTRYHRIGSPTDPARVLGDRPLECALCHADWTAGQIVDAMERAWPVRYPRQRIEELYGSISANVLRATLERGKPHEQAVAMAALAEAGARDAIPLVARQLLSDYPLVRQWAQGALRTLAAGRCEVDLAANDAAIARAAAACGAPPSPSPRPAPRHDEEPED